MRSTGPSAWKRQERKCERPYFGLALYQLAGVFGKPTTAEECPLPDGSGRISAEGLFESNGLGLDFRSSAMESRNDGLIKCSASNEYMRASRAKSW